MTDYSKITALYSRLSVGDEDRDGGESNSIQNQKIFLENYARGQHLSSMRTTPSARSHKTAMSRCRRSIRKNTTR